MISSFSMETQQILTLLVAERDRLNRAIEALGAGARRRGRPRKSSQTSPTAESAPKRATAHAGPKRKPRTAAQRKAHSERMAFWAKRRKQGMN
jgi:hypothetical protein